jgi:hypothetical protein
MISGLLHWFVVERKIMVCVWGGKGGGGGGGG